MTSFKLPDMDYAFTQRVICSFISQEAEKYQFKGGVVALSGGLDSSLVAVLSHIALQGRIALLFMPYGKQDQAEADAQAVASMLQIPLESYNIGPVTDQLCENRQIKDPRRKGNIMARLRMNLLFDVSARDGLMVIGTSNKSELLTGYSTWFGDSAACIMPIGDLYKTQARALAYHCHLPESILTKAPSAELWEGQTDEDEMGISYEILDQILYHWIDQRHAIQSLIDKGFDSKQVHQVAKRCRKALYKHKLPIICKISDRTIGLDYRLSKETMNMPEGLKQD